jgi:PTH1 family peptidyl-tRNA hydrolase
MNLSGQSVARLARFFKVPKEDILIVYDDVDTALGKIKFKAKGSAGGHNGIKSIIQYLGIDEFPRLKVGIGSSGAKGQMVGHVLGEFEKEEVPIIEKSLAHASESVKYALANNLISAMNHFNRREKPNKEKPKNAEDNAES